MRIHGVVPFLLACFALTSWAAEPERERPDDKRQQILVDSQELVAADEMAYLAFPALVRVGDEEILVSYKRGRSHARDPGAVLEVIRFDTQTNQVTWRGVVGADEGLVYQMGEWIEFPSGRIGLYADVQRVVEDGGANRHHRTGTYWARTDDGGQTFSPMEKLGPVDGVEYGYIFDGIIANGRVYMLAMTFPEMSGRKSFFDEDGRRVYGEVSVLASDDDGDSWRHVRNLSQEFGGIDINESSLVALGDGYLVATRGYDARVRLHRVDEAFRLVEENDLTATYSFITGVVGRPRLFWQDGGLYLLGRNHSVRRGPMELALFRLCPDSLGVTRYVVLDPDEGQRVGDSYYAVPYFRETQQSTVMNVITYRQQRERRQPDIVRLEFVWDQIR